MLGAKGRRHAQSKAYLKVLTQRKNSNIMILTLFFQKIFRFFQILEYQIFSR